MLWEILDKILILTGIAELITKPFSLRKNNPPENQNNYHTTKRQSVPHISTTFFEDNWIAILAIAIPLTLALPIYFNNIFFITVSLFIICFGYEIRRMREIQKQGFFIKKSTLTFVIVSHWGYFLWIIYLFKFMPNFNVDTPPQLTMDIIINNFDATTIGLEKILLAFSNILNWFLLSLLPYYEGKISVLGMLQGNSHVALLYQLIVFFSLIVVILHLPSKKRISNYFTQKTFVTVLSDVFILIFIWLYLV